jgi:hypothetical protein
VARFLFALMGSGGLCGNLQSNLIHHSSFIIHH